MAQNPGDAFARYGLAMEYRNAGNLDASVAEFQALTTANPDYSGAYYHYGQTLEQLKRYEEARGVYQKGIEVTGRAGNAHARSELEAALSLLP